MDEMNDDLLFEMEVVDMQIIFYLEYS